jgi:hypothetical chaperone protein
MTQTLAIDFGTSNSAAAVLDGGAARLIALEGDAETLPTAVFFDFDAQEMLIGHRASAALLDGLDGRYMRGLKSLLGTGLMRESRMLLGERLDFIDIVARFLARVKTQAEAETGLRFDRALSGRPVLFHSDDPARNAQAQVDLAEAYARAGFSDVQFMPEPEAAALANRDKLSNAGLGLIVDIGGGTSDFTLFRSKPDGIDILTSNGVRLGGTDFDKQISVSRVMPQLGMGSPIRHAFGDDTHLAPNAIFNELATWQKIPFLYTAETRAKAADLLKYAVHENRLARLVKVLDEELGHDLAFAVEAGKIAANDPEAENPVIRVGMLKPRAVLPLPNDMMTEILTPHAGTVGQAALDTLQGAGVDPEAVTDLIFVGGSSLMAVIEDEMRRLFPKAALHRGAAMTAIIEGLALATA